MSAYLRSLIKIRTCFPGEAAHWLKNLLHKQQAWGLESGFSQCMQMWGECGGLPAILFWRPGRAFHSKLASYMSCVSKLYVQSRAQASANMMGRNRERYSAHPLAFTNMYLHLLKHAQPIHFWELTHTYHWQTYERKKIRTQINIRCKNHFSDVPIPSKRKREIKQKLTKQTHIPKSKQQQNPAGSGVSAKCDMMKLEQKHKSPWFRNYIATAASCWDSFGACSLQYGYTFI